MGKTSSTILTLLTYEDLEISASFSQIQTDNDGLTNYEELINLETDPNDNDTDNDGFNDFDEDRTDA